MLRLESRSRFIMSLRLTVLPMYLVMVVKLARSKSSSPTTKRCQVLSRVVRVGKRLEQATAKQVRQGRQSPRTKKLEALALGDVVGRLQQLVVLHHKLSTTSAVRTGCEPAALGIAHLVVVIVQKLGGQDLVLGQEVLQQCVSASKQTGKQEASYRRPVRTLKDAKASAARSNWLSCTYSKNL